MKRIVSGIQPTGSLHIGNLFGAISNWVDLQYQVEPLQSFFFIADLHSLTEVTPAAVRKKNIHDMILLMVACGVDPKRACIFRQSSISFHAELAWILMCTARTGWLNRMVQYKEKAGDETSVSAGLYTYPVLQAADILLYEATHVPVGEDQFQHLQLTRDIAQAFNHAYGETFKLPEAMVMPVGGRIMSLFDGKKKMSKSDENAEHRIDILDEADVIARKIKRATTDTAMLPESYDDLADRAEARNLVNILSLCRNVSPQEALDSLPQRGFGVLKRHLTDALVERLEPIQKRFADYQRDSEDCLKSFTLGGDTALFTAELVYQKVYDRVMG